MNLLVLDTATAATVAGVLRDGADLIEHRHDPAPGERPGHVEQVLALAERACADAGLALADLGRIGVGVGPGSFTGLRIGIATGRALAGATGAETVAVSTLGALAAAAGEEHDTVLAVVDARRGEAFVARYEKGREVLAPRAVRPEELAGLASGAPLAVGDGAVRFREHLEPAGAAVPEDASALHGVRAAGLAALAADAPVVARDALVPEYVRAPDAKPRVSGDRS